MLPSGYKEGKLKKNRTRKTPLKHETYKKTI